MKKTILMLALGLVAQSFAQVITIADTNLKKALLAYVPKIDLNDDGQIQASEAQRVAKLDLESTAITSLADLEAFPALRWLDINENHFTHIDLSKLPALSYFNCESNLLQNLTLGASSIDTLICGGNFLKALDLSQCAHLKMLKASSNFLQTIDLSNNAQLQHLDLSGNPLFSLDLSHNTALRHLGISTLKLSTLDLSQNKALTYVLCSGNMLSTLDLSNNLLLEQLECSNNALSNLDLRHHDKLAGLNCGRNQLASLNIPLGLGALRCPHNQLQHLDIPIGSQLQHLELSYNPIQEIETMHCKNLISLQADHAQLSHLDVSTNLALIALYCNDNPQLLEVCINLAQELSVQRSWKRNSPMIQVWNNSCGVTGQHPEAALPAKQVLRVFTTQGQELPASEALEGFFLYQYSDHSIEKLYKQR